MNFDIRRKKIYNTEKKLHSIILPTIDIIHIHVMPRQQKKKTFDDFNEPNRYARVSCDVRQVTIVYQH
jgi:diadenosine tetraphosphate (Ap4A) HIT family hydrolase